MRTDIKGIENDPAAVSEAIRRLAEVAVREDCALISETGGAPDDMQNAALVEAISRPVRHACRYAIDMLVGHLGSLIGHEAARDQLAAILAEQRTLPEVRAAQEKLERTSGKPAPSTLRSVH